MAFLLSKQEKLPNQTFMKSIFFPTDNPTPILIHLFRPRNTFPRRNSVSRPIITLKYSNIQVYSVYLQGILICYILGNPNLQRKNGNSIRSNLIYQVGVERAKPNTSVNQLAIILIDHQFTQQNIKQTKEKSHLIKTGIRYINSTRFSSRIASPKIANENIYVYQKENRPQRSGYTTVRKLDARLSIQTQNTLRGQKK